MDPNEALTEIITAAFEGRGDNLFNHAEDLAEWLSNGGFHPKPEAVYQAICKPEFDLLRKKERK